MFRDFPDIGYLFCAEIKLNRGQIQSSAYKYIMVPKYEKYNDPIWESLHEPFGRNRVLCVTNDMILGNLFLFILSSFYDNAFL